MIHVASITGYLQEVGQIAHVAKSGRIIISLVDALSDGSTLCDNSGNKIARVMEVIGPVSKPFASAIPLTNNISPHIGKNVFLLKEDTNQDRRREHRKGRQR